VRLSLVFFIKGNLTLLDLKATNSLENLSFHCSVSISQSVMFLEYTEQKRRLS